MKKIMTIEIKKGDLPKHRAPIAVNQKSVTFSSKKDYRRKREKENLRREVLTKPD
jgi:hypothetical protein